MIACRAFTGGTAWEEPMHETYYDLLEIAETASQEVIRSAYRRLAQEYHPDKLPEEIRNRRLGRDAVEMMCLLNDAYRVLSNPQERAAYDRQLRLLRASTASPSVDSPPPSPAPVNTSPSSHHSVATPTTRTSGDGRPFGIVIALGCAVITVLAILAVISAGILREREHQGSPANQQLNPASPVVAQPASEETPTARLEPVAYSHSKSAWATTTAYSHGLPNVSGLGFYNWLSWGAGVSWNGSYSIRNHEISLMINDLHLPGENEQQVAKSWKQERYWDDVAVGYYVELRGATFDDYTLSRFVLFFRTFAGDKPPAVIEKTLSLLPVVRKPQELVPNDGEWIGTYEEHGKEHEFVFRIRRDGNTIEGARIDFSNGTKTRETLYGWVLDGKVTLLARPRDRPFGASLVASEVYQSRLKGYWRAGLSAGTWEAEWRKPLDGSVDDLPVTAASPEPAGSASRVEPRVHN